METPQDIFDRHAVRLASDHGLTAGLTACYQFDISGADGGCWTMDIVDGTATVSKGDVAQPDVVVRMKDHDFVALNTGRLNGGVAFMTGKLKVKGDMSKAMKLGGLLSSD